MGKRRRHSTYETYARRNRLRRLRPLFIILGIIFAAAVAAFAAYFFFVRNQLGEVEEKNPAEHPAIPVIEMGYGDKYINPLHGYTQEMDLNYVRDRLYLLEESYDIPLKINLYDNSAEEFTYRVIDTENENLIQNGTADKGEAGNGVMYANVRIDNLIEENKEYVLDMMIKDAADEEIHYYILIKKDTAASLKEQIDLALEFNSCIYNASDDDAYRFVSRYMETDYLKDNNRDLGNVTLVSSIMNVTWNQMAVSMAGEPEIEVLDSDGEIGYIRLNYLLKNIESGTEEFYRVSEYYRLRVRNELSTVLNYERKAEQIFEPDKAGVGVRSAKLGIQSSGDIEIKCNPQGTLSCFVANNTLWAMDTDTKTIKRIFSFSDGLDDLRGNYGRHAFRIVNVSDEGDIMFLIYGYMNKGRREGRSGIGVYTYSAETETVKEEIFVPSDIPYIILENVIGSICFLNSENDLYIMLDEYLYKLDISANEAVLVTDGLNERNYKIHTNGRYIAWQKDGLINDAGSIIVLDMETDETFEVEAAPGCSVKIFGFLSQDLVYGEGKTGEKYIDESGREYLLMTDMYVVSSDLKIQTQSNSGSGYYVDSVDEYNRVIIKRVVKSAETYRESEDYTIYSNELDELPELEVYSDYEDYKKTVWYVVFADNTTQAGELNVEKVDSISYSEEKVIDISNVLKNDGKYYVYAKGDVQTITEDPARAVNQAYEDSGIVLRSDGSLFYRRSVMPGSVQLPNVIRDKALQDIEADNMTDVTGITLVEAMYYIGNKLPFAWEYEDDFYIILGYDYNDNINMLNVRTGEEITLTYYYVDSIFETSGHCYVIGG